MARRLSRGATPRVGISACLLGRAVRYDGASKEERFLSEELTSHLEWVPVCPEVEIGLGVPRPRIDLTVATRSGDLPRMMQEGVDLTPRMLEYSENKIGEITTRPLAAYVFKARSPSCGLGGVKQIHDDGIVREDGAGVFASEFARKARQVLRFEESAFAGTESREAAVTAIFTLARWYARNSLSEFHRQHRSVVMARGVSYLLELDRMVDDADSGASPCGDRRDEQRDRTDAGDVRSTSGAVRTGSVDERSAGEPVSAGALDEPSSDPESSRANADVQYLRMLLTALHRVPTRDDHLRALTSVVEALGEPHGREARERHVVATHLVDRFRQGAASLGEVLAHLRDLLELRGPIHDVYFEPHPPELRLLFSIH